MPETLKYLLHAIRKMMEAADIDHEILSQSQIDPSWFTDYEHQRIVNSFLFNYIKIQDKMGRKLFHLVLQHWREDESDNMTMLDILNRLEKLDIIESVEMWDKLREIRNAITHEYPEEIDIRIDNIRLALWGYLRIKEIITNIEQALA